MAVNYSTCLAQIPIQRYGSSFLKYPNTEFKSKSSSTSVPLKKAPVFRITASSIRNKVYEDKSQGIVCYQDERGEIVCEGYDEGPCFQRIPSPIYHPNPRDAQIRNLLLRQGWLQIVNGEEELDDAVEGLCLKEKGDLNCNGFNSYR